MLLACGKCLKINTRVIGIEWVIRIRHYRQKEIPCFGYVDCCDYEYQVWVDWKF